MGKQADMVVLAEDPMAVAPATLKDIKVLKTIRRGEIVYEASPTENGSYRVKIPTAPIVPNKYSSKIADACRTCCESKRR